MVKPKSSIFTLYKQISLKHKCFTITEGQLYCLPCSLFIKGDAGHISDRTSSHVRSKKHQDNQKAQDDSGLVQLPTQRFVQHQNEQADKEKRFKTSLVHALIASGIPLYKLESEPFMNFLDEYTSFKAPSRSAARKYEVPKVMDSTLDQIRAAVGNNEIFIMIDETVDRCDRSQVNVIIGVLNGEPYKSMLLNVEFIDRCDSATVVQVFIRSCIKLWRTDNPPFHKVRMLMSDQAAYMIAAGKVIKGFNKDMLHVTCMAHCFSRVAETVREFHPTVNSALAKLKAVLKASRQRKIMYREITGLCLPPKPILTRWTTWLLAAEYLSKNLSKIKEFASSLKSKRTTVKKLRKRLNDPILTQELFSLTDFYCIIGATEAIQKQSMRVDEAWEIIDELSKQLDKARIKEPAQKFESSIKRNPDLEKLFSSDNLEFRLRMKYAPCVSADVERSFSVTKKILAHDRCKFTEDNLKMHYMIQYNRTLTE